MNEEQTNRELIEMKKIVERLINNYIDTVYKGIKLDNIQRRKVSHSFISGIFQAFTVSSGLQDEEAVMLFFEAVKEKFDEFTEQPQEKIKEPACDPFNMMEKSRD